MAVENRLHSDIDARSDKAIRPARSDTAMHRKAGVPGWRSLHLAVPAIFLVQILLVGQIFAGSAAPKPAETIGSGDGRIHVIPSLSAPSAKNGEKLLIRAVVKAADGVARVTARVERETPVAKTGPAKATSRLPGPPPETAWLVPDLVVPFVNTAVYEDILDTIYTIHKIAWNHVNPVNPVRKKRHRIHQIQHLEIPPPGRAVATLDLRHGPRNQGGVSADGAVGLWQTEWRAEGLEEGYYRVSITVTDGAGHSYTDSSLRFSDPIAGNNAVGTSDYPHGGMRRMETCPLWGEDNIWCAVVDTAGGYAYFGTGTTLGRVVKVALGSGAQMPTRVGGVALGPGEGPLTCAAIDPAAGYAYFGTNTLPGRVIKVALGSGADPPERVGAVTLNAGENFLWSAVIAPAGAHAYFGTNTSPGIVVKVSLGAGSNPPERAGALTLDTGENSLYAAVIDPSAGYAYFGARTSPGRVVKVALGDALTSPTRVGAVTLNAGENNLNAATMDPAAGYAYFGTYTSPGIVVKVELGAGSNPPTRIGAVTLSTGENTPVSAGIDTASGYAYFGTVTSPGIVVKVALGAGAAPPSRVDAVTLNTGENQLWCAVIRPTEGDAFFGTSTSPGQVVKVALGSGAAAPSREGALALNGGEGFLRCAMVDSAAGYAYFAAGTAPGRVVKVALGSRVEPPRRVGSVTFNSGEDFPYTGVIDPAAGYAYFGTNTTPGYVVKVALGTGDTPPSRVGAVALNTGENVLTCSVIDPVGGYAYFGTYTSPARVVMVALGNGSAPPTRAGAVTLDSGENTPYTAAIAPAAGYAYFGTYTTPGRVVKVALGDAVTSPTRVGAVTLNTGENLLRTAVLDPTAGYAWFGTSTFPGRVVKVSLGSGASAPARVNALTLNTGEDSLWSADADIASGYAYFGTDTKPGRVVKVALGLGDIAPRRVGSVTLESGEERLFGGVIGAHSEYALFGTNQAGAQVVRVGLSHKGFLMGTRFTMPETSSLNSTLFYSHAAAGSVRLALYDAGTTPALVWRSGVVPNIATNDWLEVPVGNGTPTSVTLSAGDYWLAWQTDTATTNVASLAYGNMGDGFYSPMVWGRFPAQLNTQSTPTTHTLIPTDEIWSGYIIYGIPPDAPTSPSARDIGLDRITWTWVDNSGDETGFKVYSGPGAVAPQTVSHTTGVNAEEWMETGLAANTLYSFQVAATNLGGDSAKTDNYSTWTLIQSVSGLDFSSIGVDSIGVASLNTPSNLNEGISGLLFSNSDTATNSGWRRNNTPWISAGLTPNAQYTFTGRSRNGGGTETEPATAAKYTLAGPPSAGNNVVCDRTVADWRKLGTAFTFSNPAGFGTSTHGGDVRKVSAFRYHWDGGAAYVFTGGEPAWNAGALVLTPGIPGVYYMHLQALNAENQPNPETLDYGPFLVDGTAPLVTITVPTDHDTWETNISPLAIGGTAGDLEGSGVAGVAWRNSRGGSGAATGTANWSAGGVVLYEGVNVITVEATDIVGNTAGDILTVTYEVPPAAPSDPRATTATLHSITWTWRDNSGDEAGFHVFCAPGSAAPTTLSAILAPNSTQWTTSTLAANSQYAFQVAAFKNVGGDSARTDNSTTWTLAATPLQPWINGATQTSLNVRIAAGDGNPAHTEYAIHCETTAQWVQNNGTLGSAVAWKAAANWGTVYGLTPNTRYTFRAKARNGAAIETPLGPSAKGKTKKLKDNTSSEGSWALYD